MTYNNPEEAQSALQTQLQAVNVVFGKNSGVRGSELLSDNAEIIIEAGTAPEYATYLNRPYFDYAVTVNGRPSRLSKHTLFDSMQWIPATPELIKAGKCPFKDLKPRNQSQAMAGNYTLITVTDSNGKAAQLPFFTKRVVLLAKAMNALVPVFGDGNITEENKVKYIAIAPPKSATYCILQ